MHNSGPDAAEPVQAPAQTDADRSHLRVAASPAAARTVVERVRTALGRVGWSGTRHADAVLAVDEAVQNAVEHGSVPEAPVDAHVEADPQRARVVIVDRGRPDRETPSGEPQTPDISDVRGRGRLIMAALADEVRWLRREDGTEVELIFHRESEIAFEDDRGADGRDDHPVT